MPQCDTKSALDKNLKAAATSKNPSTTFTEFNQPPDFGKAFIKAGKAAKMVNGKAKANPNPPIPAVNCQAPPSEVKDPANREPKIGPVQEKETKAKVNACRTRFVHPLIR